MGGVFTKSATEVIRRANQIAIRLNHKEIDTEHILFALLEDHGAAAKLLSTYSIAPEDIYRHFPLMAGAGNQVSSGAKLPLSPHAKIVIEHALEEFRLLRDGPFAVGPEFILLGLLREREGTTGQLLWKFGLRLETVREQVKRLESAEDME